MERGIVKILGNDATTFAACFYNEKKVTKGEARLVEMLNFGDLQRYGIHSPVVTSRYLRKIADQNTDVKHPQKHIMFSLPGTPTEEEKQQLINHAKQVLRQLGYANQPTLIYEHNDTGHWHLHCVTVTVSQSTGQWINNYKEGRRARRYLDELRGINTPNTLNSFLDYKFETKEQFLSLLRANGYRKSFYDDELEVVNVIRNGDVQHVYTLQEINEAIDKNRKYKEEAKDRIKQLKSIILDRRQRSMNYLVNDPDVKTTRDGKLHTVTERLRDVRGAAFEGDKAFEKAYRDETGHDVKGIRKAQFKQFVEELKEQLGLSVVFNQWKDGSTKGYTLIDHKTKAVFKGSDILPLDKLLNPAWKKGQEKDLVLTADEANQTTQQFGMSENIADSIYNYLEDMGVEVTNPSEAELEELAVDYPEESENRQMAADLFRQIRQEFQNNISEFSDEYTELCEKGQEAYNHAFLAEWLHQMDAQVKQEDKPVTDKENLNSQNIGDYVLDGLEHNNIGVTSSQYELPKEDITEDVAVLRAYNSLQKAIAHERQADGLAAEQYAAEALAYAQLAETLHDTPDFLRQEDEQEMESYTPTIEQPDFIMPFVDVKAEIFMDKGTPYIEATVDGEQLARKKMGKEHYDSYLNSDNKANVALLLALHYFPDEIQKAQIENFKEEHFKAGKMPFGIEMKDVRVLQDNRNSNKICSATFVLPNNQEAWRSHAMSKQEYSDYMNGHTAEQIACRKYGRGIIGDLPTLTTIDDIKKSLFGKLADFDSIKAVEDTAQAFGAFSEGLCSDFLKTCGEAAATYLDAILHSGDGITAGGGGGQSSGNWGSKDDDDRKHKTPVLFRFNPSKRHGKGYK